MRQPLVVVELDPLRVDEHQARLVGRRVEEDGAEHRVDRARLSGSGGPGDQSVRHQGQVGPHRLTGDVLAEPHGRAARRPSAGRRRCRRAAPGAGADSAPRRPPPSCRGSEPGCGCRSRPARTRGRLEAARPSRPWCRARAGARSGSREVRSPPRGASPRRRSGEAPRAAPSPPSRGRGCPVLDRPCPRFSRVGTRQLVVDLVRLGDAASLVAHRSHRRLVLRPASSGSGTAS